MTCEVSFNLVCHGGIGKIQWDKAKFDENGQPVTAVMGATVLRLVSCDS